MSISAPFALIAAAAGGDAGVSPWIFAVPALVTLAGTAATFYAARYSARKAGETDTIKLGVTELVDQLRAERTHLETEVEACKGECAAIRRELEEVKAELIDLRALKDRYEEEIVRLKRKAGEL